MGPLEQLCYQVNGVRTKKEQYHKYQLAPFRINFYPAFFVSFVAHETLEGYYYPIRISLRDLVRGCRNADTEFDVSFFA